MASSDLNERFGRCPTSFQHLLIRAVLTATTLYERIGDFQNLSPSPAPYSVLLWSYVLNSANALQTLGHQLRFSHLFVAPALLRLELECLISALWIMGVTPEERNRRLVRIIRKSLLEYDRSKQSDVAQTVGCPSLAEIVAIGYLDIEELRGFHQEKPAPSIRQMADAVRRPELYEAYRRWSAEMHAGFGMHIREGLGDIRLQRIEHLVVGCEYLFLLLEALEPTMPDKERRSYTAILGTFRLEYLERVQDAFFSTLATTSTREKPENCQIEALRFMCGRFRPNWGRAIFQDIDDNQAKKRIEDMTDWVKNPEASGPISSRSKLPPIIATDVVRGRWGKRFSCVSARFKNVSRKPVVFQAQLREGAGSPWRPWYQRWRMSCEEMHNEAPLQLLPNQSGYLMFPGSVSRMSSIELDSKEPVGRVDVCRRPHAALQTVRPECIEVVTLRIRYVDSTSKVKRTVYQPIVVA